ncbi:MAG: TIGR01244 family phosphatase [Hyphomicrobiaceae bacterium]|nr:TIGR01244 family phosphatase [Hyphomicrobiaceae bacterium]
MMIRRVSGDLAVADQITVEDVKQIAEKGFRSIVCNRPDGEAADQPQYAAIEAAAKAAGLSVQWQPVISGQLRDEDGAEFARVVAGLPAPVLAFCRTGTRCMMLWSLSQAGEKPVEEILATAQGAGYDLAALAPRLAALAASKNA